jgi:hypothetical protein
MVVLRWNESLKVALLGIVTLLVWLGGLPLAVRPPCHFDSFAHGGPLLSVFVLSWVLLLGILGWQARLTVKASRLAPTA